MNNAIERLDEAVRRLKLLKGERPYSVLIVDDEEPVRKTLKALLNQVAMDKSCKIFTAECCDGVEAIKLMDEIEFDFAFVDVVMPRMDGIQVLKSMKARDKNTHAILVTGYADAALLKNALSLGALEVLAKPVDLESLAKFFP